MKEFSVNLGEHLLTRTEWGVLVKAKAGWSCERCGVRDVLLHSHHKDRDQKNNSLDNGECLCHSCHSKEHSEAFRDFNGSKKHREIMIRLNKTPEARARARKTRIAHNKSAKTRKAMSERAKKTKFWESSPRNKRRLPES